MTITKTPPLSEFIDLSQRRAESRAAHGYKPMSNRVTVAVYDTVAGTQTLIIRISEDLAERHGLLEGARMACSIHPDQKHIALSPGHGNGAALFRPRRGKNYRGRSLVFQTTLREGTLEPQQATPATMMEVEHGTLVITL